MSLSLFQTSFSSPFQDNQIKSRKDPNLLSLPKSLFPSCERVFRRSSSSTITTLPSINASLIDNPVMWAGRLCVYYALLKAGLVGPSATPLISEGSNTDLGFSKWFEGLQGRSEEKEATNRRKLVRNWHPTTKGTLKRSYRVTSKSVGQRLLKAIAALLSDDDSFLDAASHKGCQIRRESAHGESVCCNNVRALFDELPTPHLVLEITAFPAGPLTEKDYAKAEKLEKVLRSEMCLRDQGKKLKV
ncbi:hypothetical protein AQUCO_00900068v1 [Aquilegia coerulea]|uniref:Uncharacterized protein n=1 Tax=Aquilegia coerulea TaxID=218851 RepID=A0A2G5EBT4_AQUCA|nr:hypothetical protein AQUCO_00900068v1 [Aquilegia coerulea]